MIFWIISLEEKSLWHYAMPAAGPAMKQLRLKKELVDCYVFTSAVNRYEAYIEALNDNEEYELFNFDSWI